MKYVDYQITVFKHHDFEIFVFTKDGVREAWLRHKDYGIMSLMFGCLTDQVDLHTFYSMVEYNLESEILMYERNYMDLEEE